MSNTTLVTREQEHQTATSLYGDNADLAELFENIRKVAPWANDRQHAMDNAEIGYVIRRSVAMGLDPLNPHEVQVWKDGKGVHFQLSYTLLMEWVRHFYGEHTEPKYRRLSAEELEEQGMQERDVAYEVTFLMKKDIPSLTELVSAGYDAREAREMLEIRGTGAATASEWSSQYFAANGRTKAWKVQKRALTDAIRRKFGTPTRVEIEEIRRAGGLQEIGELEHYEGIPDNIDARGRAALIKTRAHQREHQERLETDPEYKAEFEETARAGVDAMFGEGAYDATQPDPDPEPDVVEADYRDAPDPEPVEPQPEPPAEAQPDLWDAEAQAAQPVALDGPIPAELRGKSWHEFRDGAARLHSYYQSGQHVFNTLKGIFGEDYHPWASWDAVEMAKAWDALVEHAERKANGAA